MKEVKLRSNQTIFCIENDHITKKIEKDGVYEVHLFSFLKKLLSQNNDFVCLDSGANIGVVTLTMSMYAKHVIAFEPIKSLYSMIKKTLDANQISNCEVLNIGLSSKKEKSRIYINTSGNIGSSTLSKEHSSRDNSNSFAESELIDLDVGDENILLQSLNSIDLIKIDVEGHESDVVIGLRKLIKKHSPIMILEWNNSETKSRFAKEENLKDIFKIYHPYIITNNKMLFRQKTQKNFFRSFMRIMYNITNKTTFLENPILKDSFEYNGHYSSVAFVPKSKKHLIKDFEIIS